MRQDMIRILQDTLQIMEHGSYSVNNKIVNLKLSRKEMETVQVLLPKDVQDICCRTDLKKASVAGRCEFGCENIDSFAMAVRQYQKSGSTFPNDTRPVLVLNLANPVNPGGGVRRGARAQEEDLCRKSSLLLSLESRQAWNYYQYNRSLHTYMGSDAMMFTPKVEIIRDEKGSLLEDTVIVSVLTCAAPMLRQGKEGMSEREYQDMVYNRIMGMLKCSAYFGYRYLVLGAWGCGAFANDAHVMSDLFCRAIREMEFGGMRAQELFCRIDFAVLDRTREQYNFKEFSRNFASERFPGEENVILEQKEESQETPGQTEIELLQGDITKNHHVQAIVNAANTSLLGGGGVDGAIYRAAGPGLLAECRLLHGCKTGKAKLTKAYKLPCEYVIHTPGPHWNGGRSGERELLASCYRSCLELAVENGIRSIAFPSIATGIYHFPLEEAAGIAIGTAKEFAASHPGRFDVIKWVLFDEKTLEAYRLALYQ